ncbi:MAG: ABC transporter ATP-binding protein [Actinomycetaceae bacterium]
MTATGIELSHLTKRFGAHTAVDEVSLRVPKGSFLVLLGPSGCGKTTILRMLSGLEHPTSGTIAFDGRTVSAGGGRVLAPGKRNAGLVFQSYALWPHMTVRANVEWPLKVAKQPPSQRRERVREVLELLGIDHLSGRYPGEISGGQQQRVAIARMIAPAPGVLLFDEPLSNLDAKLRVETRGELVKVHRATGATSVYVTHDQVEAMTMATHVALMKDGTIQQFGPPEELLRNPATSFVATFIGTPPANILRCRVEAGRASRDGTDLGPLAMPDGEVDLMYRAESLEVADGPGDGVLRTEFAEATELAGRVVVTAWQGRDRVSVVANGRPDRRAGDELWVRFPDRPDAVFDAASGDRVRDAESLEAVR